MLNVVLLNVIMLSVVMLNVAMPKIRGWTLIVVHCTRLHLG
jgi:hypothetical protein